MNKTNDSHLFMGMCAMVIFGILVILKLRRRDRGGAGESAGRVFDEKLKDFSAALNKATQFVQQAIHHAK